MGLIAVLVGLLVATAAAATPPTEERDETTFVLTTASTMSYEIPFTVDEAGQVGLYLQLHSGATYDLHLGGVGACDGLRWAGGYVTGVHLLPWTPNSLWECGEMAAGEHALVIDTLAGAGVMTAYLSGAHWAEASSP